MNNAANLMQNKKVIVIGVGIILILVGAGFFVLRRSALISPLAPQTGVRVIFVSPNPNGLENIAPSPEGSASASPKSSSKSSATATGKALATATPKTSSASASPKN